MQLPTLAAFKRELDKLQYEDEQNKENYHSEKESWLYSR